ncbi:hypothetical protein PPERSA_12986 [Pseudocohnilembus persalinus]|uniref:Transcription factor IIIC subunit 5 HTH domain-containing protein n=1 Tax=Pseudocohnilembus persalinus TaxID=266149 RepID=A0A0V0R1V3_PSEPJ|nr:hypothetical protein PPERSA_12986 [Pseudocohnilembus persalinus]|eukprot:KRX08505.1 hypothetical protein PPERSA_12986 [Pseudocohnilembus persalinus]
MSFKQIQLPLKTNSFNNLGKHLNLEELENHLSQDKEELDLDINGGVHFIQQETEKYVFKMQVFRNKKDHKRKLKKLIYIGKLNQEYFCNELKDFHYETPIPENLLIQSIKQWPKEDKSDFLKDKIDPIIYSQLTVPSQFMKNYKHKNVDLFKEQIVKKNNNQANEMDLNDNDESINQTKYISTSVEYDEIVGQNDDGTYQYRTITPQNTQSVPEEKIFQKPIYKYLKVKQQFNIKKLNIQKALQHLGLKFFNNQQQFEIRPIWLRNTLLYKLAHLKNKIEFTQNDFKKVLSLLSYTFGNGPWKFAYVKFGYSPKQNFESINYQVLDIAVQEKDIPLNHQLYNKEFQIYDPTYIEKPGSYRHLYQICDIQDQNVVNYFNQVIEIQKMQVNLQPSKKFGWFEQSQLRRIQKIMKDKFRLDTEN